MKIEKNILASFDKLYAQAVIWREGQPYLYLSASEGNGPCVSVDAITGQQNTVWEQPGGTMTICQLNASGDFLAVQKFLPVFDAAQACIVYGKHTPTGYEMIPCMNIPYIHRFEILTIENTKIFVGATLCGKKEHQQDWSHPGKVYVGVIPDDPSKGIILTPILENITKNHGFTKVQYNGKQVIFVSGAEGLFLLTPPAHLSGTWEVEKLIDREISDMAVVDFDGDGIDEIAVIEGFHGNRVTVNKACSPQQGFGISTPDTASPAPSDEALNPPQGNKNTCDSWKEIYSLEGTFGHALWGGKLLNKNRLIIGWRRPCNQLICLTPEAGSVQETVLGFGGSSQISVWEEDECAMVYSADREAGEAVLYRLSESEVHT